MDASCQYLSVYRAADLAGAPGPDGEWRVGQEYNLLPEACETGLILSAAGLPPFVVAPDSPAGSPGADVYPETVARLTAPDGSAAAALVLAEVDASGALAARYVMALSRLRPGRAYRLTGLSEDEALSRFAHATAVSFLAGTQLTLANGAQVPVEALRPGDRVLTRDDGARPVRWIGHNRARGDGAMAPVMIRAGTMNTLRDLRLMPAHRLFFYQRQDVLGAGRAEVLVRARDLVDGAAITRQPQPHLDLYQVLFDNHQIVFAEGICVESSIASQQLAPLLPPGLALDHRASGHDALELDPALARRPDLALALARASRG